MSEARAFRIGIDLGQRVDNSAVCLVEETETKTVVRLLTKYPLGTPYPSVMRTIAEYVYKPASQLGDVLSFAVDATGVGTVPAQMLQEMLPEARVEPFIFTNQKKRELVGKVKVLHSFGKLRFATKRGDEYYNRTLTELITEMKQLQAKVIREDASNPEIEVFKTGQHDDLFTALALAVKDISIKETWEDVVFLSVSDRSWVKTPLDSGVTPEPIFFGG
mgnify:FL=1